MNERIINHLLSFDDTIKLNNNLSIVGNSYLILKTSKPNIGEFIPEKYKETVINLDYVYTNISKKFKTLSRPYVIENGLLYVNKELNLNLKNLENIKEVKFNGECECLIIFDGFEIIQACIKK